MELKCDKCPREDAQFYSLVAGVSCNLCPKCRTDAHTYISTELDLTELWDKVIVKTHAQNDPLLFPSANAEFLDVELRVHMALKKYIYGTGDSG